MNVRITPRGQPQRTDLYSATNVFVDTDEGNMTITFRDGSCLPLPVPVLIALDEDGAVS